MLAPRLSQDLRPKCSHCCRSCSVTSVSRNVVVQSHRVPRLKDQGGFFSVKLLQQQRARSVVAHASLDDPEMAELVRKMEEMRPDPPANRDKLQKCVDLIDALNAKDPNQVTWEGSRIGYRLLYSQWITDWVRQLDPKASDEVLILARGRTVEGWRLSEIKRDNYPPSGPGYRQWQGDKKRAQAARLVGLMKDAGYEGVTVSLVEEVMLGKEVPDPQDIRAHDLKAPLGGINYRLLEQAAMLQTLRDADALVFLEKSFPQMFSQLKADEVLARLTREMKGLSNKCMALILQMPWSNVQRKLIARAFPTPRRYERIMKEVEGVSAASSHPGDWRFKDFDYE